MEPIPRKLLTIVTESALEERLRGELRKLGATGFTVLDARGKGSRGVRDAGWSLSSNIQVEVVCDAQVAERIGDFLREHYYADYAMIIYLSDVTVLRPDKF
jgi:nitrogen regulatory protein PII